MTALSSRRGRVLAAAVFTPLAFGLAAGPAAGAFATDAEQPPAEEDSTAVEIPGIDELDIPNLPEPGFETIDTWSADTERITDLTTEDGPIGIGPREKDDPIEPPENPGEDPDDPTEEPGEDPDDPTEEPTNPPKDDEDPIGDDATAEKVVLVDGEGDGDSNATVSTYEREADGSYTEVDSYEGHVGSSGIAAPGAKKEGDSKTPSGTFSLDEGFGHKAKPKGFSGEWTEVQDGDIWVDDPKSDRYNEYVKAAEADGYSGEDLAKEKPAYNYSWVVDYNRDPAEPGKGSAIFLHVNTGSGATAGCISLPEDDLLDVIEWAGDSETEIQIQQ